MGRNKHYFPGNGPWLCGKIDNCFPENGPFRLEKCLGIYSWQLQLIALWMLCSSDGSGMVPGSSRKQYVDGGNCFRFATI